MVCSTVAANCNIETQIEVRGGTDERIPVQLLALLVDGGDVLAEGVEGRDDHLGGGSQDVERRLAFMARKREHRTLF